jgi:hypothetical protein
MLAKLAAPRFRAGFRCATLCERIHRPRRFAIERLHQRRAIHIHLKARQVGPLIDDPHRGLNLIVELGGAAHAHRFQTLDLVDATASFDVLGDDLIHAGRLLIVSREGQEQKRQS